MNLIYACVFHQKTYIEMLELLLKTLALKGNLDSNTDILIYTQADFEEDILKLGQLYKLPLKTEILDISSNLSKENPKYSLFESSRCRLNIFYYKDINKYSKILYLDTDILINGNINNILNLPIENDKLYAVECGKTSDDFYGSFLFENTSESKPAFSASVLFFKYSPIIKTLFDTINTHITTDIYILRKQIPTCLEQPYVVYNSITQNKYNNQLLNPYVLNYDLINSIHNVQDGVIVYHFAGVPGHYMYKYPKMTAFLDKIIS
jgi:lipopolysaccharide biosynthesis glycosyltransferase